MSLTLIRRIKTMTGDSHKFRYEGSIFPWRGRAGTVIPAWACIDILRKMGWNDFRYNSPLRMWEAKTPDGQLVSLCLNVMRGLVIHAVYDHERNLRKPFDNTQHS
jgi:hypothetical protein